MSLLDQVNLVYINNFHEKHASIKPGVTGKSLLQDIEVLLIRLREHIKSFTSNEDYDIFYDTNDYIYPIMTLSIVYSNKFHLQNSFKKNNLCLITRDILGKLVELLDPKKKVYHLQLLVFKVILLHYALSNEILCEFETQLFPKIYYKVDITIINIYCRIYNSRINYHLYRPFLSRFISGLKCNEIRAALETEFKETNEIYFGENDAYYAPTTSVDFIPQKSLQIRCDELQKSAKDTPLVLSRKMLDLWLIINDSKSYFVIKEFRKIYVNYDGILIMRSQINRLLNWGIGLVNSISTEDITQELIENCTNLHQMVGTLLVLILYGYMISNLNYIHEFRFDESSGLASDEETENKNTILLEIRNTFIGLASLTALIHHILITSLNVSPDSINDFFDKIHIKLFNMEYPLKVVNLDPEDNEFLLEKVFPSYQKYFNKNYTDHLIVDVPFTKDSIETSNQEADNLKIETAHFNRFKFKYLPYVILYYFFCCIWVFIYHFYIR